MRKYLNETVAKNGINLIFVVMLVVCLLFAGSAKIISVSAAQATAIEDDQEVQQLLRQIDILETKLDMMEAELDGTQAQNEHLLQTLGEVEGSFSIEYAGTFYATSYCCEAYPHICGGNGVTASGTVPTPGLTVAADWSVLPAGTWIYIDGVGMRRVEDTGSAIKGQRLDVAVDTHANALAWPGQGNHDVWIIIWSE